MEYEAKIGIFCLCGYKETSRYLALIADLVFWHPSQISQLLHGHQLISTNHILNKNFLVLHKTLLALMYETVLQPDSAISNWCVMILDQKNVAGCQQASESGHFPLYSDLMRPFMYLTTFNQCTVHRTVSRKKRSKENRTSVTVLGWQRQWRMLLQGHHTSCYTDTTQKKSIFNSFYLISVDFIFFYLISVEIKLILYQDMGIFHYLNDWRQGDPV